MPKPTDYISGFPEATRARATELKEQGKLLDVVLRRYPGTNTITNNAALYTYAMDLKRTHLKSSDPLSKVRFSDKISALNNALGLHTFAVRVQGNKAKRKNEIRIASVFKEGPPEFLHAVLVHELAHLRHRDHDKAFYRLCTHIEPDYQQYEVDMRLWLFAIA